MRSRYEEHHKVKFEDSALIEAVKLSHRYVMERKLPDKAIDLIDEAAAKLRVAIHSMPKFIKEKKTQLEKLQADEEAAWAARDYENAAKYKTERVRLETEYSEALTKWRIDINLDDVVGASDIAEVVSSWTGIPVKSMLETEAEKLLQMEDVLKRRIIVRLRQLKLSVMPSAVRVAV